jgi:DinB superfamily
VHPQFELIAEEYQSAQRRLHELACAVPVERWGRRTDPDRWSVAECVAHLNLTSTAYPPLLREAVDRARALNASAPGRYRRDPVGWLLWKTMGPPVRVRTKTIARSRCGRLIFDRDEPPFVS